MDSKITVGMDISQTAHMGGVSIYTKNISKELSKIQDLEMTYFYSSLRKPYKGNLKNVKSYRLPPSLFEIFFNKIRNVSIEKFIGPCKIFHSSDWIQPPTKAKKVTTYHDLVPLIYPQWSHPKIVQVHRRRLELVEREIDMVIAVSESTKKDLLRISKIPEEKIVVIHEGPTINFKPQTEEKIKAFKQKYKLPEKYVLTIGGIGERKNLARIKEAAKNYNLVIAGETLPWLSEDELGLMYSGAKALLYCSLYEGFGLPIVDAFACGLPVITSQVSSMPEVGGDAALYVDPLNVSDIKEKIEELLNNKTLKEELVKKGFERLKEFSWEKTAQKTAQVYRNLAK